MFDNAGPGADEGVPVPRGMRVAGCHAYPPIGPHGQPRACNNAVVWTGVVLRRKERGRVAQVWQSFACAEHPDGLIARRRLLPRDWELLAGWREEADRWRPGHTRRPPRTTRPILLHRWLRARLPSTSSTAPATGNDSTRRLTDVA